MKKEILKFPISVLLCNFVFLSFSISLIEQGYTLVWSDEFDEDGKPNPAYWSFEKGFVRNHELQWYQDDNAYCKDGVLIIEGRREKKPNPLYVKGSNTDWRRSRPFIEYTSSSLKTAGKKEFCMAVLKYGHEYRWKVVHGRPFGRWVQQWSGLRVAKSTSWNITE